MDSRNLNGLENQSTLGRRGTLVGSGVHRRRMGIHSSIRTIHSRRIILELGSLGRPLAAIVSGKLESRDLILEHLDHLPETRVRTRRSQGKLACRLLALTIDTELQGRIKLSTIDSRASAGRTLGGIQLALQTFPRGLLSREQRNTAGGPTVSAPFSTRFLGLIHLVLGGQFTSLRRTHRRSFILVKAIVRHMENLLVIDGTQRTHIGDNRFGLSILEEDIDLVSRHLHMKKSVLNHDHEQQHDQCHHNCGRKDGTGHESHQDDDDHQGPHANGDGCIGGNHLLSKGHTNYARA
jgi:hypothetical protein